MNISNISMNQIVYEGNINIKVSNLKKQYPFKLIFKKFTYLDDVLADDINEKVVCEYYLHINEKDILVRYFSLENTQNQDSFVKAVLSSYNDIIKRIEALDYTEFFVAYQNLENYRNKKERIEGRVDMKDTEKQKDKQVIINIDKKYQKKVIKLLEGLGIISRVVSEEPGQICIDLSDVAEDVKIKTDSFIEGIKNLISEEQKEELNQVIAETKKQGKNIYEKCKENLMQAAESFKTDLFSTSVEEDLNVTKEELENSINMPEKDILVSELSDKVLQLLKEKGCDGLTGKTIQMFCKITQDMKIKDEELRKEIWLKVIDRL